MKKVYLYDGSFEGFLTIVFNLFKLKMLPKKIQKEEGYSFSLFEESEYIETDIKKSNRVINGIKKISLYSMQNINYAFLSNSDDKESIIFDYIINLFRFGDKVEFMRNIPSVVELERISKSVKREAHRFKGFVRFEKINDNVFYAEIEPDNDILKILCIHFKNRLKNEVWIINDKKRKKTAFYNKIEYIIMNTKNADFNKLIKTTDNNEYQKLWKSFYKNVNIKERKNLRCQMNFMPKKYWKNLTEMRNLNE